MSKYLVVDGGATKTTASLRDGKNTILANAEGKGTNFQVIGIQLVVDILREMLEEIMRASRIEEVDVLLFALAGIDCEEDQVFVEKELVKLCKELNLDYKKLVVENDAFSTLLGLTKSKAGVLVISGTGSIAYAHNGKGASTRAGGWGHRSGDEGSGYWIGREILRAVYRMEDGRDQETLLRELVFDYLKINSIDELLKWHYSDQYSVDKVADLMPLLSLAVVQNDETAINIFERTSIELVALVDSVIHSSDIVDEVCSIYFNGGTIRNFEQLFINIKQKIESKYPEKKVKLCLTSPIESIYRRAKVL